MLSPGPSTAPSGLSKPSSPTISSPIQTSFHPQTSPLPLSPPSCLTSTPTFPLVDISDNPSPDPVSHPLPTSPPILCVQPSSPQLDSKPSPPPAQKPMPPQVSKPPLPAQLPSALPKSSSSAMPRPSPPPAVRPSSPPQPRPPPPIVPKPPVPTSPVSKSHKPIPPGISILEKLIKTCPVWLQLGMKQDRAMHILSKEFPGIFLVRRDASQKPMVLAVCLPDQLEEPHVKELPIKEEKSLLYLEGSVLVFENIFKLIAFYCVSRDILPFPLKLPQVIQKVAKYEDMEVISSLGSEFWNSALNSHEEVENVASSCGALDRQAQSSSCEIQLSIGSDRLWYVNPIFIEECSNSLPPTSSTPVLRTQSLNTPVQAPPKYKRPPPLRPPSAPECSQHYALAKPSKGEFKAVLSSPPPSVQKGEGSDCQHAVREQERQGTLAPSTECEKPAVLQPAQGKEGKRLSTTTSHQVPPIPIRRRLSEKQASEEPKQQEVHTSTFTEAEGNILQVPVASLICLDDSMEERDKPMDSETQQLQEVPVEESKVTNGASMVTREVAPQPKRPNAPVAPPRKKRPSHNLTGQVSQSFVNSLRPIPQESILPLNSSSPSPIRHSLCINAGHPKVSDVSLYSPDGGAPPDHDSYSTSSTEEEVDTNVATGTVIKRTPTIMLDRAKQRLSMVTMANLSNVLTGFMNADRKLQKRIVELSRDGNTYFGNLVKDYRAFTLDTMRKHTSSTEMLQEIRQMITQLKSYLIQSAELQNLQEAAGYSEEKLEIITEAALCKSVLKPLREAVYNGLKDIHSRTGNLKKLKENQQVVQGTTTTDLGVTTSVPEMAVMEKIQTKLGNLHQEYSPQKKIDLLLKTCKIIYESMSVGCPGKAYGADDFLPVLMYVLARCNISALLLDVEYMMELMDPALQLGEGSYYLTTTYGALEHIKNFDKQAVTKQLSLEIQDSIHRWERRRTLNKARASRSSVQDFINVSFLEAGSNTKTLGLRPNTTAQDLCNQCAEKFEVLDPESYCLSVLVDGHDKPLAPEEFPLTIKSTLHHSEPRKEYYFVYRHGRWPEQESVDQTPSTPAPEESLI
ncbi:ras and Rab interactor 3-like isoform X2 [Sinocyclocheilus rhinocerous]|uniref:ras and Rab interactor 3-like isoform X1 n=1 Tax=Sinocyclocheilus rhinocerous TaxID=307959 RepID=UPI0007B83B3E|nr:PREDICTED: ras and Rab interactor 3-like isoform X1 [Sinocyclocheilus rhinocerous]XP_016400216.1 PREDICTED: ras and Rab interactor 3-like isoform X2 [Sinocyclocheilus rhinocerous]